MFPTCTKCGCEYLDERCGGWTPETPKHDCVTALKQNTDLLIQHVIKNERLIVAIQQEVQITPELALQLAAEIADPNFIQRYAALKRRAGEL